MGLLDILGLGGGNGNGAAPGATGAPAADQGGFLSMLGLNDPEKRSRLGQGLIALGGSMMKAGGPSYTPNNFLGALGEGMNSFSKSYSGSKDDGLKRQYLKAQIGNMGANTVLHQIQAQQAQQQAAARAAFNGTVNPNGAGSTAINTTPGAPAPGAPAPGAPAVPGQVPAPGAPMDIKPPAMQPPQAAPAGPRPPQAAPGAPAGPVAPVQGPAAQGGPTAPQANGGDVGSQIMARISQHNQMAQKARAAGYDDVAKQHSEAALAWEKQAVSQGLFLGADGNTVPMPGYAAGKGQIAQAESAAKSAGELPSKLLLQNNESDLRMKEQAAKDASGDKKTFDDRAKDMNATWNANEYNKKFLAASNIRAGFDRAYKDNSGLGTAQLVLDWYKLNDPGSVVSQNEIATLSTKTQSLPDGMVSAINQALTGGGMSPENKEKILRNMDGKYQDQRKTYETQRDNQRKLAGKIGGIDPTMVVPDLAELHSPWKSPAEIEREQNAAAAAARAPALGGGGALAAPAAPAAPRAPAGVPKFNSPNDPGFAALKPGDRFEYNGQVFQKN
ncbi:hypothetical protein [Methylobacterium sp. 37f]|uniref:hypothetical protein n=1 Tax=Methylobacterium sp. 37f TaxID=2817058 RepID=UPI001FFCFBDA|nr:hypothetical protein [Methylobacterium sp. 37f]MCK2056429.1 hypothetical protein [Methylobacterium sp. 37f]